MNKVITLKERPSGKPEEKNFEFKNEENRVYCSQMADVKHD